MSVPTPVAPAADPHGYAWNWFALHSAQRMQMVNFWLVAVAFLAAAFVQASTSDLPALAVGVAMTGALCSSGFLLLDLRTRELVRVAERALRNLEVERLATEPGYPQLVSMAEAGRSTRLSSYRLVIEGLQATVAVLFLAAGIHAVLA